MHLGHIHECPPAAEPDTSFIDSVNYKQKDLSRRILNVTLTASNNSLQLLRTVYESACKFTKEISRDSGTGHRSGEAVSASLPLARFWTKELHTKPKDDFQSDEKG